MEKIKMEKTNAMDLNKSNRRAFGALYEYYLENNRADAFIVPLIVDNSNKTVLTVTTIKASLFAFCVKTQKTWMLSFEENSTDDAKDTSRVKLYSVDGSLEDVYELIETTKANQKRESSQKTKARAEAKKSVKQAEADALDKTWNVEKTKIIMDFLVAKCKLSTKDFNDIQNFIAKTLEK